MPLWVWPLVVPLSATSSGCVRCQGGLRLLVVWWAAAVPVEPPRGLSAAARDVVDAWSRDAFGRYCSSTSDALRAPRAMRGSTVTGALSGDAERNGLWSSLRLVNDELQARIPVRADAGRPLAGRRRRGTRPDYGRSVPRSRACARLSRARLSAWMRTCCASVTECTRAHAGCCGGTESMSGAQVGEDLPFHE